MAAVDLERRAVRVAPSARHAVQSYESKPKQRKADRDSKRLSAEEHGDLLLLWGGYEAAIGGCRSASGAILDAALRAPPRERPVWNLVCAELERRGGRVPLEKLVAILADEGMATAHEVRRALRAMQGVGRITKYVQDEPERVDRWDPVAGEYISVNVMVPTEVVRMERLAGTPPPSELAPEERWRREDDALRAFCEGVVPCHETRSCRSDGGVPARGGAPPANDVRLPRGIDRCILERVYGTSHHPAYRDVLGGPEAAVVEYTEAAEEERVRLGAPSVAEAIRLVLDGAPDDAAAAERWRQDRDRFVTRARAQAGKLIDRACEAFRSARSG